MAMASGVTHALRADVPDGQWQCQARRSIDETEFSCHLRRQD